MRCIFCKESSAKSVSAEHILPESLGNQSHMLPPGIVCDACNNYFARKIEKPVLESRHFLSLRFQQAIPNKRGKVPVQKAILMPNVVVELSRTENGATAVRIPPEHWEAVTSQKNGTLIFPSKGSPPDQTLMSRFLAKVAVEAMALRLIESELPIEQLIDEPQLDPIRNWARRGFPTKEWAFNERIIYEADHQHFDEAGKTFQCINEFDFFGTEHGELYFCLAIFGVEYTINMAGSSLDGYLQWLSEHHNASPLYTPKPA